MQLKPPSPRLHPILVRLPVIVAAAFALYSVVLLAHSWQTWQRMKRDTNAYLVADSQRRAVALGDYVGDLRNEAAVHADIFEIRAFLLNRDLGMSLRYGLGASLQAIEDRFRLHANNRSNSEGSRIVYVDLDGKVIADSDPSKAPPPLQLPLKVSELMRVDVERSVVVAEEPVVHKGVVSGWVVTEVPAQQMYRNLMDRGADLSYRELLLTPSGRLLSSGIANGSSKLQAPQLAAITAAVGEQVVPTATLDGLNDVPDLASLLLVKSPVPGISLNLVTLVTTERAYGHLSSPGILAAAAVVPILLLLGALWLDRMRQQSVRLHAEIETSERERRFAELRSDDMAKEISRRQAVEALVIERSEQLKAIFSLSPDGFVSFDRDRRVQYVSPALNTMTGIDPSQLFGLSEAAFVARFNRICAPGEVFPSLELLAEQSRLDPAGPDTRAHLFEVAGPPPRVLQVGLRSAEGTTISQILWFRDVTIESEVDRMKSEFLSTAAHELRTPMASVLGFSEVMLARGYVEGEQGEFLEIIHRNATLMATIIDELLDLARIEARRGKDFTLEMIDLEELLYRVAEDFRPPENRGSPVLVVGQVSHRVRGDRGKLTQAILNVLSNAYKYSQAGTLVELQLVHDERSSPLASRAGIRIRDYGIGMTSNQTARVFDRFYRADSSGKVPGTGLGMSIVKEIVELHGGQVAIDSTPGMGTAVTIWLNVPAADDNEAGADGGDELSPSELTT